MVSKDVYKEPLAKPWPEGEGLKGDGCGGGEAMLTECSTLEDAVGQWGLRKERPCLEVKQEREGDRLLPLFKTDLKSFKLCCKNSGIALKGFTVENEDVERNCTKQENSSKGLLDLAPAQPLRGRVGR